MDLVVLNGIVIDPETQRQQKLNLGIMDGSIAQLSMERLTGKQIIDATGLIVAPGFIDIHAHEDFLSPTELEKTLPCETAKVLVHTGVTTMVGGNCGLSAFPIQEQLAKVAQARLPLNYYTLVGYITLRYLLGIGIYEQATAEQIVQLKTMVEEALSQGALGVSFGLQYAPGITTQEVIAISEVVKKYDKYIAVHMRYDYPHKALEAVQEMIEVAKITGVRIQISHLAANVYGGEDNLKQALVLLEECKREGLEINADMYPYDAWATSLQSAVFDAGVENFNFTWEDIEILTGTYAEQRCSAELFEKLRKQKEDTAVVCHQAIPTKDLELALCHPLVCLGSDGQIRKANGNLQGHPRSAGSPARLIGEYVRKKKLLSLEAAISKLTLEPAQRLKLSNKGRIQKGKDADLTIFDFTKIAEQSRYGDNVCALPAQGIFYVLVGGKIVYENKGRE